MTCLSCGPVVNMCSLGSSWSAEPPLHGCHEHQQQNLYFQKAWSAGIHFPFDGCQCIVIYFFFQLIHTSAYIAKNLPPSVVCCFPVVPVLVFENHFHQVSCCQKYGIMPPTEAKHVLSVVSQLMHLRRPAHVAFPVLSHGYVTCGRCSCGCCGNDTRGAQFSGFSMVFSSTL